MTPGLTVVVTIIGLFVVALPYVLLARISHWTHATKEQLAETNRLLAKLAGERRG